MLPYSGSNASDKNLKQKFRKRNNSRNTEDRVIVLVHCTCPLC